jgi:hypothetical protein
MQFLRQELKKGKQDPQDGHMQGLLGKNTNEEEVQEPI